MDTIHHLLRLNVEIEGAIRVLADRDNEIAMRILDEKTRELVEIVSYLAHPEEISSTNTQRVADAPTSTPKEVSKGKNQKNDGYYGSSEKHETITISDEDLSSDSYPDKTEENTISRETIIDKKPEPSVNMGISPEHIPSDDSTYKSIKDNTEQCDVEIPPKVQPSHPEDTRKTPDKCLKTDQNNEASKEKMRIDEMLSRREARDLSKAFTINDRFRFQLHIFDGDKATFNKSIEAISGMDDLDTAMAYLSGIVDIESEDQDIIDFITIIKKHFDID
ncbi:MAG: hypothetical protein K2K37_01955 [Muribaculaceae bacterium]|nr:hypothetical protein [Muribaculaceae bacterium]